VAALPERDRDASKQFQASKKIYPRSGFSSTKTKTNPPLQPTAEMRGG